MPSMSRTWTTIGKEAETMLMQNPPHPGEFVKRQCLEPLGLTVTEAAKGLGVSRNTLSMLLNGALAGLVTFAFLIVVCEHFMGNGAGA